MLRERLTVGRLCGLRVVGVRGGRDNHRITRNGLTVQCTRTWYQVREIQENLLFRAMVLYFEETSAQRQIIFSCLLLLQILLFEVLSANNRTNGDFMPTFTKFSK